MINFNQIKNYYDLEDNMPHFDAERNVQERQISNYLDEIRGTIYAQRCNISNWEAVITGHKQGPSTPPKSGWEPFDIGSSWGGKDVTVWFRAKVTIPESMDGKRVVTLLRPGGEALAYLDGKPCQGLDSNREEILLAEKAKQGTEYVLIIEAYSHARFEQKHGFQYADLAVVNEDVRKFYWDIHLGMETAAILPENSALQMRLHNFLNKCVKAVNLNYRGEKKFFESVKKAQKLFNDGIKEFQHSFGVGSLLLAGHSHIDTAWLWPLRDTQRKCARTFSTVLKYMDEYPEYYFTQSQPQLYEFTKKYYPDIYEQIKRRIRDGRWEPIGATWVEQDSNISSGESLVRQALYGNRFFQNEFGIHTRTCWLPDAFGYCWSLPQILKKAGVDTFITTKIDWSQYNKFPYSLFVWKGIDGSEVLGMMPPLNYNGNITPKDCLEQWRRFKQKDIVDEVVFSFGYGDGGGGATKTMLENGKRLENMVGVPKCSFGRIQDYIDRLEENLDKSKLPVWNGELYLQYHRACQTTQARTKRNNRKSELLYRDAEFLSSMAMFNCEAEYKQNKLYEGWKVILCNQFHDILPGSSIQEVYDDADKDYAKVIQAGEEVQSDALKNLNQMINTASSDSKSSHSIIVYNSLSWKRDDIACIKAKIDSDDFVIYDAQGNTVPMQIVGKEKDVTEIIFEANGIPPMGYTTFQLVEGVTSKLDSELTTSEDSLENSLYKLKFADDGTIESLYDKVTEREVIAERGNVLQLFEDRPHAHDAWDIDFNFEENMWEMDNVKSLEVVENGPVRATIRVIKTTDSSTITQDISVYSNIPRIDFVTHVDWWEKHKLLKVAFPVQVLSPKATYEIQFGTIERPTHFNTSWDRAMFEVPAQKWADLSEGNYGVSLLNDCKYGHDTHDNVMRISLLRSPTSPDPHADEGEHDFTYSLYPHSGDWRFAQTTLQAYQLNCPLITQIDKPHEGSLPQSYSFAKTDQENVIIETIKKAEDSDDIIVRVYEAYGQRGDVTLKLGFEPANVAEVDLMEGNEKEVEFEENSFKFCINPYEIKTFKITK